MSIFQTLKFITNHPINKRRKIEALYDFLKFQLGIRILDKEAIHHWIEDINFIVKNGENSLTGNLYNGLFEFIEMAYLLHLTTENDMLIDVGANVGSYLLLACGVKGAKGYGFEPIPSTFNRLKKNMLLNDLLCRVKIFNQGIGDSPGTLLFSSDLNCTNHILFEKEIVKNAIKIPVKKLDDIMGIEKPTILKIDVEGYELPVLRGAQKILANESLYTIIIEMNGQGNRYGFNEDDIVKLLSSYDFYPYSYDPYKREIVKLISKNTYCENTIFIRNEILVKDKVKNSKRYNIKNDFWI